MCFLYFLDVMDAIQVLNDAESNYDAKLESSIINKDDLCEIKMNRMTVCNILDTDIKSQKEFVGKKHLYPTETPAASGKQYLDKNKDNSNDLVNIEKPFKCQTCGKEFTFRRYLNKHIKTHVKDKVHQCSHCSKVFAVAYYLSRHLRKHKMRSDYKCNYCDRSFKTKNGSRHHLIAHFGEETYQCAICNKEFPSFTKYRMHVQEGSYTCKYSMMSFKSRLSFDKHLKTHLDVTLKCKICTDTFRNQSKLANHIITEHLNKHLFECEMCQLIFKNRLDLITHRATHIEQYQCEICCKKFYCSSKLTEHLQFFHRRKIYLMCPICKIYFKSNVMLRDHLLFLHVNSTSKCTICKRLFILPSSVRTHMKQYHPNEGILLEKNLYSL